MGNIRLINIKNRAYYLFKDMINTKDFDTSLLKLDKKYIQKYWYMQYWLNRN